MSCQDLSKAFGTAPLFKDLSFGVFEGDHIGVVGPNGAGKSTLLKILAGIEEPSDGIRSARKRLKIGFVEQDPGFPEGSTVDSVLRGAIRGDHLEEYEIDGRIAVAMGKADLVDEHQPTATLSGGWKKRLAIARELVQEPELLLLDEPTNHLDIDGILWLEELLPREPEAFVAVSHDRYFLEAVASRVIEINRAYASGLFDAKGRYSEYLVKKDDLLAGQAAYQESLRNRVRGEVEWLSRKAKARTRKAQARIDSAGRLKDELKDLDSRSKTSTIGIEFAGTERRTKRLVVTEGLRKSFGDREVVSNLDLILSPGMRLGLLGANGSGKSTLMRLLAKLDAPDAGTVTHADKLKVVMFDQHRARLDPGISLKRTLAPFGDSVIHDGRSVHVGGWAKRFLFRTDQLDTPVGRLSGGEQARVLIARLMLEPADLLLLDEPTNDLDIPTLEVLEESLLEFGGALVLVTHDRYLLDRVSTQLLALDGQGGIVPYADYAQWEIGREFEAQKPAVVPTPAPPAPAPKPTTPAAAPEPAKATKAKAEKKKLSYLEQREWAGMEKRILEIEAEVESLQAATTDTAVVADHKKLQASLSKLSDAQGELEMLYARWAELEAKVKGA